MLNIIYGRAATGKTYTVLERVAADAKKQKSVVLLVPEQFTFESERSLLNTFNGNASTNVSVLSFTRLYDEILRICGGRVADTVTDFDRVILMGQAISAVADKLVLYGKYVNSSKFTESMVGAVTEFKTCNILPEDLTGFSATKSNYLMQKLHDISEIYAAYNALLKDKFSDPLDDLTRLADVLQSHKYFADKTVYIDSFKSFSGQQYKILKSILSQADDVTISVTSSDINSKNTELFLNVNKTLWNIKNIAESVGCELGEIIELKEQYFVSENIKHLENSLIDKSLNCVDGCTDVSVTACKNIYDEAEFAAKNIRRLVRESGYRYRDFVIIARNADTYKTAIERECRHNNVFCYFDDRRNISQLPLIVYVSTLLKLTKSITTDTVLELQKTMLGTLNLEEIFELENYTYIWKVPGKLWAEEWKMSPNGLCAEDDEKITDEFTQRLIYINELRARAIGPILSFKKVFKGTPEELVTAIFNFLEAQNIAEKMHGIVENELSRGFLLEADINRQSWDILCKILNGLVKCLPDKEISIKEFVRLFDVTVSAATIGNIPQMLDEVTFGSADRIRPSRPKIAFILGANQGVFPATVKSIGLFADAEREELINGGIELNNASVEAEMDEEYLVYTSLCCATEKLFVSYSLFNEKGEKSAPSTVIKSINNAFSGIESYYSPNNLNENNLPETAQTSYTAMCALFSINKSDSKTVSNALNIDLSSKVSSVDKSNEIISNTLAEKLYGKNIAVSATAFDTFHRCKFSYFCKYGMKLGKLEPADFNVLQRGTIVHYVLECFINNYGKNLGRLTREKSDELVDRYMSEYFNNVPGFLQTVTPRVEFIINRISVAVKDVAYHIVCEFAQSKFTPEFCEMKIGSGGTLPLIPVAFGENGKMLINGSIDRVDKWNGYVRIVDYKTGEKKFYLSDVLVGQNLQMLIYLYAIIRGKGAVFADIKPAGICYMPAKRNIDDNKLTMNGLLVENDDVQAAMELENHGEYVPKLAYKKDGDIKSASHIPAEAFENIFDYIEILLKNMGSTILGGNINVAPVNPRDKDACAYCNYKSICGIENKEHTEAEKCSNSEAILKMKEAKENGISNPTATASD